MDPFDNSRDSSGSSWSSIDPLSSSQNYSPPLNDGDITSSSYSLKGDTGEAIHNYQITGDFFSGESVPGFPSTARVGKHYRIPQTPTRRPKLPTPPNSIGRNIPRVKEYYPTQASTTVWDEENTLCLIVDFRGVMIARRCDNDMINGTKLLNSAKVSRGRRDGILKSEPTRVVTKVGQTALKGVWIPLERALKIANNQGISKYVTPLFDSNIESLLYHEDNLVRTQQVVRLAIQRNPKFSEWLYNFPSRCSSKTPHLFAGNDVQSYPNQNSHAPVPSDEMETSSLIAANTATSTNETLIYTDSTFSAKFSPRAENVNTQVFSRESGPGQIGEFFRWSDDTGNEQAQGDVESLLRSEHNHGSSHVFTDGMSDQTASSSTPEWNWNASPDWNC